MNISRSRTCCIWRTHTADTCTRVGFIIGFPAGVRKSCRFQISRESLRFVRVQAAAAFYNHPEKSTTIIGVEGGRWRCARRRRNPFEWSRARASVYSSWRGQTRCNFSTSHTIPRPPRTSHLLGRWRHGGGWRRERRQVFPPPPQSLADGLVSPPSASASRV